LVRDDEVLTRRVERAELPILYVKCLNGPHGDVQGYARAVAEFERIARRESIRYLQEGGADFEGKLAEYKGWLAKAQTAPGN
jgi:hypothetical protein